MKIVVIIVIIISIGMLLNCIKNETEDIQKVSLSIADKKNFLEILFNKNDEEYYIDNIDTIILYDTVMLPMEQVFEGIFGDTYIKGISQELVYDTMKLNIQLEENKIEIPEINTINGIDVDNSVEVEIEEVNGIKYIPLYLISNFPTVRVKIDNKVVYENDNYLSGKDAIHNGKTSHDIVIETKCKEDNNTYTYAGQNLGALWREEALKRIEKNRKKDIQVIAKNQNGVILDDVTVNIHMINNEFKFGTAIRFINPNINRSLFNIVGSENYFKWRWISEGGYTNADTVVSHAVNNNLQLRGHTLWWDYACCEEVKTLIGNKENLQPGTMAYIYNEYSKNVITREQAEIYSLEIQEKFENIVLKHIEEMVNYFEDINEWDVVNEIITQQYFKYYLYDRHFLNDNTFLNITQKESSSYEDNEDYYNFLARCFDKVRAIKPEAKLVLNDNIISGYVNKNTLLCDLNTTKNLVERTKNIDVLGVQYHVNNVYNRSPQSYYNSINHALQYTNIKEAAITEYDNYVSSKKGNYTAQENKTKADYLRDSLIMAYSNKNINEFVFWVYACDHFEEAEREAYTEVMQDWLHYENTFTIDNAEGCTARVHKGDYVADVKLGNKQQTVQFHVSDTSDTIIEVIFESKIEKIDMDALPNKILYYQNAEELLLDGGKINIYYDDGTVEQKDLIDTDISVTGFDNTTIGEKTIKVVYKNKEITFNVEIIENFPEKRLEQINRIYNKNKSMKEQNEVAYSNSVILKKYENLMNDISNARDELGQFEKIENVYEQEIELIEEILIQYHAKNLNISEKSIKEILLNLIKLSEDYKVLYSYYKIEDTIDINTEVKPSLNNLIENYNANIDVDLSIVTDLIEEEIHIYENSLQTENTSVNYLNKQRIIKISPILSKIIDKKVEEFIEQERTKLQIVYDKDINIWTNQDIKATLKHGNSTSISNNNGSEEYIFTDNGTFYYKVSIKGNTYEIKATVNNIDKTPPVIGEIIEGKVYTEKIAPKVLDVNLERVELYFNDQLVEGYRLNDWIEEEGMYQLKAIDKAGNITVVSFQVLNMTEEGYQIEKGYIKNIQPRTTVENFQKQLGFQVNYEIQREGQALENTELVATGDTLITQTGESYLLIVAGDIHKDGIVNIKDVVKMRTYLLERNNLDEVERMAADANLDVKPLSIKDLVRMRIMVLNRE